MSVPMTQTPENHPLRRARKARGWTQKEVAERIGAPSPLNVTRWERGSAFPSAHYREKLCQLFARTPAELGLLQEGNTAHDLSLEASSSMLTASVPLWHVPHRRNRFFTGREELLRLVHQKLSSEHQAALPQAYAFSGLGGIGKTQLAIEYAYRYRQDYQAVFWVRASSRETLLADLVALSPLLALPEREAKEQQRAVEAVKDWLAQHGNWLLILDNADDLSLVMDFLPVEGEGHLLFTTRSSATGTLAASIAVEQMDLEEGTLFLLRRAKFLSVDALCAALEETIVSAAQVVVRTLGGLPLALDQAGAYIEESGCNLAEYLELYQRNRVRLLTRRGTAPTDYPLSVASTWSLSFQQIEHQNPASAELLRLCAFLDPDAIPESLVREGSAHLGRALEPVATDPFLLNEAMQVLRTFSLVRRDPETKVLSLHRLIQVVIQEEMNAETRRTWIVRTVSLLEAMLPELTVDWYQNWSRCQELLPHIQVCADLLERTPLLILDGARLLKRAALYLTRVQTSHALAERLARLALTIYEQYDDCEQAETADLLNSLGTISWSLARYDEATSFYQHALDIRQRILGTDHPDTAAIYNNLAIVSWQRADYAQAEAMYQQALAIYERTLGSEHLRTAELLSNVAALYCSQERYEQSEITQQRALAIYEQLLPPHHPLIAGSISGLGTLYFNQHRYDEAIAFLLRALAVYERGLGPDHRSLGPTVFYLAEIYRMQERHAEAEAAYHRALALYEQAGPDHPYVAQMLVGLATLYVAQDRDEEARLLYQQALAIYEQTVGNDHPEMVAAREHYTALLKKRAQAQTPVPSEHSSPIDGGSLSSHDPSPEPGKNGHSRTGSASAASQSVLHTPTENLTRREREVLYLLVQGLTAPQIAQQLVITSHTVQSHIRSIYNKLGISTRSAATRYAIEHRLF